MIKEEWAGVNYLTSSSLTVSKHKVMWPPGMFNFCSTFALWKARSALLLGTVAVCRASPSPLQPTQALNLALHFETHKAPTVLHVSQAVGCACNFTPSPPSLTAGIAVVTEWKEAFSVPVKKILSVSNCRIRHCFQWCWWLKGSFSPAFF